MGVQTLARAFLVGLAAAVAWRAGETSSAVVALVAVGLGWAVELHLLARCFGPAGGPAPGDPTGPTARQVGRWWTLTLVLLAVLYFGASLSAPERLRPELVLAILVLSHATGFRATRSLVWVEGALSAGRALGGEVRPRAMAALCTVATVAAEKEGFLTSGRPTVDSWDTLADDFPAAEVLRLAAAMVQPVGGRLAEGLSLAARRAKLALPRNNQVESLVHRGWRAQLNGTEYHLGSLAAVEALGHDVAAVRDEVIRRQVAGGTVLLLATAERLLGQVVLADAVRGHVPARVAALRSHGVGRVALLTDDEPEAAAAVQTAFALDAVVPRATGAVGAEWVSRWQGDGRVAVMARPGLWDAALSAADVSVAVVPPGGVEPGAASLVLRHLDATAIVAVWTAANAALRVDQRATAGLAVVSLLLLGVALAGLPIGLLVATDELLLVGLLTIFSIRLERAERALPLVAP